MARTRMNNVTWQRILEPPCFGLNTIQDTTDSNVKSIVVQPNVLNSISHLALISDVLSSVIYLIDGDILLLYDKKELLKSD